MIRRRRFALLASIAACDPAFGMVVLEFDPPARADVPVAIELIMLGDQSATIGPPLTETPAVGADAVAGSGQFADPWSPEPGTTAHLAAGWRRDRLLWHIASDLMGRAAPNVLSELEWKNVRMATLDAALQFPVGRHLELGARLGLGFIQDGRNRDSDWLEDDRRNEFSRSHAEVRGHGSLDVGLDLGWPIRFGGRQVRITPLVGYAWQSLHLNDRKGRQVIQPVVVGDVIVGGTPVNYAFPASLDSTYEAVWHGPYVGVSARLAAGAWRLSGRIERHRADYRADADWNLREEFDHPVSFRHRGKGDGWRGEFEIAWQSSEHLELTLGLGARSFRLRDGVDETYFADGSQSRLRLNEAKWDSVGLSVGLRYAW